MTYSATAPVKLLAGTAAAPGVTFTSDTDTGLFSPGANQVAVTTGGVQRLLIGSDGSITPSGSLLFPAGTATAPSISFTGDLNTGLYSPGADTLAASTNGTERLRIDSGGRLLVGTTTDFTPTSGTVQINGATALSLFRDGNACQQFISSYRDSTNHSLLIFRAARGSFATPLSLPAGDNIGSFVFAGYNAAASAFQEAARIDAQSDAEFGTAGDATDSPGRLVFSTSADGTSSLTERLRIDSTGQIEAGSLGTAAAPVWSFLADPDTGLYSPGANQIAIATSGTGRLFVDTTAVTSTLPVLHPLGAAVTPSISFTGDLDTGVYSPGANQLSISTAGTQKFTIDSFDGNPIIETSYPLVRPTLDLNFAATRRLDPRVTFSRASTATVTGSDGVIRSVAVNVPRFDHNPMTGESLGLLVEEARTNVIGYSEYFADSSWIKTGSVVVPNTFLSPSATFTASTLLATAANGTLTRSVTTTAVAMTFSVYLRRKTGAGNIDITANGSTWVTQTINSTEWTRCSIAQTAVAGTSNPGVRLVTSGDEVYVWGSQYE